MIAYLGFFAERASSSRLYLRSGTSIASIGSEAGQEGDEVSAVFLGRSFSGLQPGIIPVFLGQVCQMLAQWGAIRKRENVVVVHVPEQLKSVIADACVLPFCVLKSCAFPSVRIFF